MSVKSLAPLALAAALAVGVAGCGYRPGERAVSGAGIGAAGGAIVGALAGSAGMGALIGGAGGALVGGMTSPRQLNLGRPIWR
jgi:osmotically inducible lipoprotein OsmB